MNPTQREMNKFWKSVTKQDDGCWICRLTPSGIYSRITVGGVRMMGHVFSLRLKLRRPIRSGFIASHCCNNPRCVNPDHLEEETQANNMRKMVRDGRHSPRKGDNNFNTVISDANVLYIRNSLSSKSKTVRQLARELRVTYQAVWNVAKGRRAKELGGDILPDKKVRSLSKSEVVWIRERAAWGMSQTKIAMSLGIHQATVSNIIHGHKRRDVTYLLPS